MKKVHILIPLLAVSLSVCSCGSLFGRSSNDLAWRDAFEMTDQEKELLGHVYGNQDRINEGKLFGYQKGALNELRAGMTYLAKKYPDHNLGIVSFTPSGDWRSWGDLTFRTVHESRQYHVHILPDKEQEEDQEETDTEETTNAVTAEEASAEAEKKEYICQDDFYQCSVGSLYDAEIEDVFLKNDLRVRTKPYFFTYCDESIGEKTTGKELLESNKDFTTLTHLYVSADVDRDEFTTHLKEVLTDNHIYGQFVVYFVTDVNLSDLQTLESYRRSYENVTVEHYYRSAIEENDTEETNEEET